MSFINPQGKEINCKIAYYGPAASGKTTTLHCIHQKTARKDRGKIISLSDETDRTLFFDFLPLTVGQVKDYTIRLHLYTIPVQIIHDSSRKLILKGMDGLIFVVDSRMEKLEENIKSWNLLPPHLKGYGIDIDKIPVGLQFNKRDLPNVLPLEDLQGVFNQKNFPFFETVATQGKGVMECFQTIAKKVLKGLQKKE